MGLEAKFIKAANLAFKIFKESVHPGRYYSIRDTGFLEADTNYPITIIEESFSQNDIHTLSFSEHIQPTDVKGLVRGSEIVGSINSQSDKIVVTQKDLSERSYTVVAFDTDPLRVLYTFLLRKT